VSDRLTAFQRRVSKKSRPLGDYVEQVSAQQVSGQMWKRWASYGTDPALTSVSSANAVDTSASVCDRVSWRTAMQNTRGFLGGLLRGVAYGIRDANGTSGWKVVAIVSGERDYWSGQRGRDGRRDVGTQFGNSLAEREQ
jgi:hypothetical protein